MHTPRSMCQFCGVQTKAKSDLSHHTSDLGG